MQQASVETANILFAMFDKDSSGFVSPKEIAAMIMRFDQDGNGQIDVHECMAAVRAMQSSKHGRGGYGMTEVDALFRWLNGMDDTLTEKVGSTVWTIR